MDGSSVTVLSEDFEVPVWGDDAPEVWVRLSTEPPRRHGSSVLVCSAAGARTALRDHGTFSSGVEAGFIGSETGLIPLQVDPPEHVRYRRLLDPLFAPPRVAAMEGDLTAFANLCIDDLIERATGNTGASGNTGAAGGTERIGDFGREFAVRFPAGTFLRLLGLPLSGLPEFLDLKDRIIRPEAPTANERLQIQVAAGAAIVKLFDEALSARAAEPAEDILTYLTELEASGQTTREQSLNICHLFLLAGLDTVTGALQTSFALLARRPDLQQQLVDDASIIPSAVEELLRWAVTSPMQARVATADTELDGCPIHKGDKVKVLNATDNFDPTQVTDPLTVDLARSPNRHATFGLGVHRCLGSHLARLEMRIALQEWHRRVPRYRLAEDCRVVYSPALREIRDVRLVLEQVV